MENLPSCPCCSRAPTEQKGDSTTVLSNRAVLALISDLRAQPYLKTKPLKSFMCSPFVTTNFGGSTCREEGGREAGEEQCLTYKITAPYYSKMIPFLMSNKNIMDNIKSLKDEDDKIKKFKNTKNAGAMKKKRDHDVYLNKTFIIFKPMEGAVQLIKTCPSRYR